MIRKPIVLKDGILHELPVGDNLEIGYGKKLSFHLNSLASYDKVVSISYLDSGLRTQRINQITMSSVLYPDTAMVKTIFYLDVGSIDQRIDKIEYAGSILLPDSLRKVFNYSVSGIGYKLDSYEYELF